MIEVLKFSATWCGPCRALAETLAWCRRYNKCRYRYTDMELAKEHIKLEVFHANEYLKLTDKEVHRTSWCNI